jgi:hypothetical protein
MPFLILPTFAFVCRPQRAQFTNDHHIESLDSTCLSISSALTPAARTADCRFGHSLRWRVPSVKHQFNYGKSATGESEAVSLTRHAFTPSRLTEKSPIRRPSKSVDKSFFAANRVPETQSTFHRLLTQRVKHLANPANHLSSLNATVARGGRWIRIECWRPIHWRSSLCTPP